MKRKQILNFYKAQQTDDVGHTLTPAAKERVKKSLMQKIALSKQDTQNAPHDTKPKLWSFYSARYALATMTILAILSGTTYASTTTLPGDTLYPVKRVVENARLSITLDKTHKAKLKMKFAETRLTELNKLEEKILQDNTKNPEPTPIKTDEKINTDTHNALPTAAPQTTLDPEKQSMPPLNNKRLDQKRARQVKMRATAEKNIAQAFSELTQTKLSLEQSGKEADAENLANIITRLESHINIHSSQKLEFRNTQIKETKTEIRNTIKIEQPKD